MVFLTFWEEEEFAAMPRAEAEIARDDIGTPGGHGRDKYTSTAIGLAENEYIMK